MDKQRHHIYLHVDGDVKNDQLILQPLYQRINFQGLYAFVDTSNVQKGEKKLGPCLPDK